MDRAASRRETAVQIPTVKSVGAYCRDHTGEVLRSQAAYDITQPDDRVEHASLEHEIEHAQKQQTGQSEHNLRCPKPDQGYASGRSHLRFGPLIKAILEPLDQAFGMGQLPLGLCQTNVAGRLGG